MPIVWELSPELSCRWEENTVPDEITRIYYAEGEAACKKAILHSKKLIKLHDCWIYIGKDTISGKPTRLKKVYDGPYVAKYQEKFSKEFTQMKKIYTETNLELFPEYYNKSSNMSPEPYVIMEYFPSESFMTLETYLCSKHTSNKYSQQRLIDDELFTALLQKLHEAFIILFANKLLYLDLQPENILINPYTKEIRLVDFTDCYDLSAKETPIFKFADANLDPYSPPAVLLTRSFCLLIARLHYAGDTAYRRFPTDVEIFKTQYYPLFSDVLRHKGEDPMKNNYLDWPAYQENTFTMYKLRYTNFMEKFNEGYFRNQP